jgi:hypothetical protein
LSVLGGCEEAVTVWERRQNEALFERMCETAGLTKWRPIELRSVITEDGISYKNLIDGFLDFYEVRGSYLAAYPSWGDFDEDGWYRILPPVPNTDGCPVSAAGEEAGSQIVYEQTELPWLDPSERFPTTDVCVPLQRIAEPVSRYTSIKERGRKALPSSEFLNTSTVRLIDNETGEAVLEFVNLYYGPKAFWWDEGGTTQRCPYEVVAFGSARDFIEGKPLYRDGR